MSTIAVIALAACCVLDSPRSASFRVPSLFDRLRRVAKGPSQTVHDKVTIDQAGAQREGADPDAVLGSQDRKYVAHAKIRKVRSGNTIRGRRTSQDGPSSWWLIRDLLVTGAEELDAGKPECY